MKLPLLSGPMAPEEKAMLDELVVWRGVPARRGVLLEQMSGIVESYADLEDILALPAEPDILPPLRPVGFPKQKPIITIDHPAIPAELR